MASRPQIHMPSVRTEAEKALGIMQRSSPINPSWTGDIRKRYTDFLVYEIRKDGSVVHLEHYQEDEPQQKDQGQANQQSLVPIAAPTKPIAPAQIENVPVIQPISDADKEILGGLVGEIIADQLVNLDHAIQAKEPLTGENKREVVLDAVTERDKRSSIHQEIRRIFSGRIETVADGVGVITATPVRWATNRGNRANRGGRGGNQGGPNRRDNRGREQTKSFGQLGGDYLHFTLYKENKDTMDAINTIARLIKVKSSNFGFAGTKDRRAGTVQRVSVYRQRANNLTWLNTRLPNVKIGDFSYAKEPLQLGQHGGNEFIITIKNCHNLGDTGCSIQQRTRMVQQSVEFALEYVKQHGYINYFGLQRFGTYSIGTHMLGMKLLNQDYAGAVDDILFVNDQYLQEVLDHNQQQGNRDDFQRAKAISTWKLTKNAEKALEILPRRFSSEGALIRHLGRNPKDHVGAILSITRGMRMMYIHAYQSYVWNHVATYRWSKYGPNVVEGDLILVDGRSEVKSKIDENDTDVISDIDEEDFYAEARPLTAEDVASGKYTIFDVVLPTPGYDVVYPRNDCGEFYVSFMAKQENGGLNPYDMRRRIKEFSLSGNYRHLIGRFIGEPQYALRLYSDDMEQMHPTDLDLCNQKKKAAKATNSRWANFAENATQYDNAVAADRRRKASEEPMQGDMVTNDTWVQTSLDGNAKRIKIAREQQLIKAEPTDMAESSDSSSLALLEGPKPDLTDPNCRTTPLTAQLQPEPANPETQETGIVKMEIDMDSSSPMAWYGSNMAIVPSATDLVSESTTVEPKAEVDDIDEEKPSVSELTVPEFFSPSSNPLLSVNGKIEQTHDGADKIAVVLKFQLKSSNYATVVLRELMGANTGI